LAFEVLKSNEIPLDFSLSHLNNLAELVEDLNLIGFGSAAT
jgi:hypothetical protein